MIPLYCSRRLTAYHALQAHSPAARLLLTTALTWGGGPSRFSYVQTAPLVRTFTYTALPAYKILAIIVAALAM